MGSKKSDELRFVREIMTPINPKSVYYINLEESIKYYFGLILLGAFMVFYFITY